MGITRLLGIERVCDGKEEVRVRLEATPELLNDIGILHGGVTMTLADTAAGRCTVLNLPEGANTATVESKTNFLRAVRAGTIEAAARPIHIGRTMIVVETEVRDPDDRLVAKVIQTQLVLL
jgi:uncharacterized protein (TIGR00369 family)